MHVAGELEFAFRGEHGARGSGLLYRKVGGNTRNFRREAHVVPLAVGAGREVPEDGVVRGDDQAEGGTERRT